MARLPQEVLERLEKLAAGEGLELLAVEVMGTARRPTVRLVLDREGGVSLGDCESVSRQASALLDTYDPFPGRWELEVTSPGVERKFYQERDWERFAGQPVRVRLRPTWTGNRLVEGVLVGKSEGVVRVRDRREVVHELPEGQVFETRLAPFAEQADAGARGRKSHKEAGKRGQQ
jgi:ribosome maturation factor RimP